MLRCVHIIEFSTTLYTTVNKPLYNKKLYEMPEKERLINT